MMRALAGTGDVHRLMEVARSWRDLGPQPAPQNSSQQTTAAAVVAFQALALVASADEEAARLLDGRAHQELCAWAYEHLVRTSRSASGALAKRIGARWLGVHLPAAQVHGESQGGGLAPFEIHHLKALLLAQQVGEDMQSATLAFEEALGALSTRESQQRARFRILRDQARFLSVSGGGAVEAWTPLVTFLDPLSADQASAYLRDLDFSDLAAAARAAEPRGQHPLACRLWFLRASSVQWRGLTPDAALQDLMDWSRCAQAAPDPAGLEQLLDFQSRQIIPGDSATEGQPTQVPGGGLPSDSARWLRLEGEAQTEWSKELALLEARLAQVREPSAAQPGEAPVDPSEEAPPKQSDSSPDSQAPQESRDDSTH